MANMYTFRSLQVSIELLPQNTRISRSPTVRRGAPTPVPDHPPVPIDAAPTPVEAVAIPPTRVGAAATPPTAQGAAATQDLARVAAARDPIQSLRVACPGTRSLGKAMGCAWYILGRCEGVLRMPRVRGGCFGARGRVWVRVVWMRVVQAGRAQASYPRVYALRQPPSPPASASSPPPSLLCAPPLNPSVGGWVRVGAQSRPFAVVLRA
jgi:hypothetical protein